MFHVHSVHGYNISKKYPMFYQPNPQLEKSEPKSLWVFFSCSLYSFAWISLVFWELLLGSYYILRWFVCKTHPRQKIDNSFVWFTVFHLHMDVCNHIFFLSTLSTIWFIFIDKILYKDVAFGLDQFVSVHFYFWNGGSNVIWISTNIPIIFV